MFVISLDDFVLRATVLLCYDDWIALEDVKLGLQLEKVALQEKVFKGRQCLLCLLPIVLLRKTKELDEVWMGRDRVLLHKHGK